MIDTITIKDIIDEDFTNYKKPSMFIATSKCSFKCEKEDAKVHCHNSMIANQPNITISIEKLINRYVENKITKAIVFGGLEPFDQIEEIITFIKQFRTKSTDDIVIYTGYTETEINKFNFNNKSYLEAVLEVNKSSQKECIHAPSIIIKYGRFKASGDSIYDKRLGVELASSNQYAKIYK